MNVNVTVWILGNETVTDIELDHLYELQYEIQDMILKCESTDNENTWKHTQWYEIQQLSSIAAKTLSRKIANNRD